MPAVLLSQIKPQVGNLGLLFNQPESFKKQLTDLLERSGVPSYHPSQAVNQVGLIPAYHVTPIILQQIEQEMVRQCKKDPNSALILADILWADPYLEPRLLAATILGQIAVHPPEPILERLQAWIHPALGSQLLKPALELGTKTLRLSSSNHLIDIIENWLKNPSHSYQKMGLKALLILTEDRQFENIPAVFRLLNQSLKTAHPPLQNDLLDVLSELARRTPIETIVVLRQILSATPTNNLSRLARRLMPVFTPEQQSSLRETLRSIQ